MSCGIQIELLMVIETMQTRTIPKYYDVTKDAMSAVNSVRSYVQGPRVLPAREEKFKMCLCTQTATRGRWANSSSGRWRQRLELFLLHPITPVEIQALETGVAEERRRALRRRCAVLGLDIAEEVAVVHRKRPDRKDESTPARKVQNLERTGFPNERHYYERHRNEEHQVR